MPLQSSGAISFSDIATEFSDTAPHSMSEFYGAASGIPASGVIDASDFYGASAVPPSWNILFKTPNLTNHYFVLANYPITDQTNQREQAIWLNRQDSNALLRFSPNHQGISRNSGNWFYLVQETPSSSVKLCTSLYSNFFPSQLQYSARLSWANSYNHAHIQQSTATGWPTTQTLSTMEGVEWLEFDKQGFSTTVPPYSGTKYYEPATWKQNVATYYEYNTANEPPDTLGTDAYHSLFQDTNNLSASTAKIEGMAAYNYYTDAYVTCGTPASDGNTYLICPSLYVLGEITTGYAMTYHSQLYQHQYHKWDVAAGTSAYGTPIAAAYYVGCWGLYESGNTAIIIGGDISFPTVAERDTFVASYPTIDSIGAAIVNNTLPSNATLMITRINLSESPPSISRYNYNSSTTPTPPSFYLTELTTAVGVNPVGGLLYGYQEGDSYP